MGLISLNDAMMVRPAPLRLPEYYRDMLGNIPRFEQWDCTVYGRWGSGKSSMALLMANTLSRVGGPVLYCNAEEKTSSGTIGSRAIKLGVNSNNIYFTDTNKISKLADYLSKGFEDEPWKYCFIDSVNRIKVAEPGNYEELMQLEEQFPDTSFIFILHSTKDNRTFKGPAAFGFDTGIVLEVIPTDAKKPGMIVVEKSRYGSRKRENSLVQTYKRR